MIFSDIDRRVSLTSEWFGYGYENIVLSGIGETLCFFNSWPPTNKHVIFVFIFFKTTQEILESNFTEYIIIFCHDGSTAEKQQPGKAETDPETT